MEAGENSESPSVLCGVARYQMHSKASPQFLLTPPTEGFNNFPLTHSLCGESSVLSLSRVTGGGYKLGLPFWRAVWQQESKAVQCEYSDPVITLLGNHYKDVERRSRCMNKAFCDSVHIIRTLKTT